MLEKNQNFMIIFCMEKISTEIKKFKIAVARYWESFVLAYVF